MATITTLENSCENIVPLLISAIISKILEEPQRILLQTLSNQKCTHSAIFTWNEMISSKASCVSFMSVRLKVIFASICWNLDAKLSRRAFRYKQQLVKQVETVAVIMNPKPNRVVSSNRMYHPRIVDVSKGKENLAAKNQVFVSKFPRHIQIIEWRSDGMTPKTKLTTRNILGVHLVINRQFFSVFR